MNLQELIIYRTLSEDKIINKYIAFIESTEPTDTRRAYFELVKDLMAVELPFEDYLFTKMIEIENPVLDRLCHENYEMNRLDLACLKNDLGIITDILNRNIDTKIRGAGDKQNILSHLGIKAPSSNIVDAYKGYFSSKLDLEKVDEINRFIDLLRSYGTGVFANSQIFYINQEQALVPVNVFSPLPWDEIYDYEIQKESLLNNTKALVEGRSFHHVLLEGASGTGKSSSVKAVAHLFKDKKLRLIQLYKGQLRRLPSLLGMLKGSVYKFIIFIDDLSFESNDDDYKLLKSYIEGGIINEANNIAFYVTSNRQHLIKESRADREGDIHLQDSIQETTSLSARFGLHLTFVKPNQREYFAMITRMLEKENIILSQEEMELGAKRWSMRHGGMSGRIAMQFVKHLKMGEYFLPKSSRV